MFSLLSLFTLYIAICNCVTAQVYPHYSVHVAENNEARQQKNASDWWKTASFYQIYPRSFKDSDADGVGDLKGIMEKLPYLKEIGITATWLSPIFTSPMADFGYDIANFTEIDKIFGTMSDFEALLQRAKELEIGILLDFVPNHTSDECEWFIKSAANDPYYKDFYVWHPGKMVNGKRQPPTNWLSVFRGSAWEWHNGRKEYYFHQFLKKQPDLNYRNPEVRKTMQQVLQFWLQKGVTGFRIDSVPHMFEMAPDIKGNLPDEPHNDGATDPNDYGYLKHVYTTDQPETLDLVYEWRHVLDMFTAQNGGLQRVLLAETYSPIDVIMQYYGNETVDGAQIPFDFLLITRLNNNSNAYDYTDTVNTWLSHMPPNRTANWVVGNHDQNRVGSRLGADRIDMMNMLVLSLPGCSITYQGEEIGMLDVWISWNDTVDPSACNSNPDKYQYFSRDPERTPFQWSDEKNAGFSAANKTWLPIADNYKEINVAKENNEQRSHLDVFKQLMQLREEATFRYGAADIEAVNRNVFAIRRTLQNEFSFITIMNIFDNTEIFNLGSVFKDISEELEYVVVTARTAANIGDRIKTANLQLAAKEAIVFREVKPPAEGVLSTLYVLYAGGFILALCILAYFYTRDARRNSYTRLND